MADVPNPPLEGVRCHCGAALFMVPAAHPGEERSRFNAIIGPVLDEPVADDVAVNEWVCAAGHRVGVSFDAGELDLGIVRDTTLNQLAELQARAKDSIAELQGAKDPLGYWEGTGPLAGFDADAARARARASGREFVRTLFKCSGCSQWRVEPMNELQQHLLGGLGAPTCWACRQSLVRNDFHIFQEEFTSLSSTGFVAVTGNLDLDVWIDSHVHDDPTRLRRVADYGYDDDLEAGFKWRHLFENRPTPETPP